MSILATTRDPGPGLAPDAAAPDQGHAVGTKEAAEEREVGGTGSRVDRGVEVVGGEAEEGSIHGMAEDQQVN